ncbi:MAG: hypothetical protein D6729_11755 [Deltaproteobacteria bacterium]|nr:MAG: hypothetical protein D6729_11755 [Deltaproteobacteria bacterium]
MTAAPLGTYRLFLAKSVPLLFGLHAAALLCAAVGLLWPVPVLCLAWPLFCATIFASFLRERGRWVLRPEGLAACVPFAFSLVAATWFARGANDLRILGYGPIFSYCAALHGNVLGWITVGAIAALAQQESADRKLHLFSVFVCFASFLFVAVGIDQLPPIKPIGVVGLTLALPLAQLAFLRRVRSRHRAAFALGLISFVGLAFTMVLAWRNELGMTAVPAVLQIRGMVSVHGLLNAVLVGPTFLLAVVLDRRV